MDKRWLIVLTVVFGTTLACPARSGEIKVPLVVRDNSGSPRASWPVSGGIPMPLGALTNCSKLRVLDGKGRPVPAQFNPFVKWWGRDGSVKWVLVEFQADVPPGGEARYTLTDGETAAPPKTPLIVRETKEAIEVVTGPLRALISKKRGTLIEEAYLDLDGDGKFAETERFVKPDAHNGGVLTSAEQEVAYGYSDHFNMFGSGGGRIEKFEAKGKLVEHRYASGLGKPDRVVVESRGPVRVTVRVEGRHWPGGRGKGLRTEGFYSYTAWLSFYAGKPFFQVVYSIDNNRRDFPAHVYRIKDAAVGFSLDGWAAKDAKYTFGGQKTNSSGVLPAKGPCVLKASGGPQPGWADLSAAGRGLTVQLRNFWEEAPKAFRLSGGRAEAALMPDYAENMVFQLNATTRKSHVITWYLHPGDADAARSGKLARAFRYPLLPWAGGTWYADANVWLQQLGIPGGLPAPSHTHWAPKSSDWRNQGSYTYFNPGGMHKNYWSPFYRFLQSGDLGAWERGMVGARWAAERLPMLISDYSFSSKEADVHHRLVGYGEKKLFTHRKAVEPRDRKTWTGNTPHYASPGSTHMNGEHLKHVWPYEWYYLTASPIARDSVMAIGNQAKYSTHRFFFKWDRAKGEVGGPLKAAPALSEINYFDDVKHPGRRPGYFYTRIYACHLFCCAATYSATGDADSLFYARWLARRIMHLQRLNGGPIEEKRGWSRIPSWQNSEASIAAFELWRDTGEEEWLDVMGSWLEWAYNEAFVAGKGMPHRWPRGTRPEKFERHWYQAVAAPEIYVALGDPRALEITKTYAKGRMFGVRAGGLVHAAHGQAAAYVLTHPREDAEPPEAVRDLAVAEATKEGVKLTWTAPKDAGKGSAGKAARYWIKYADKPIVDHPKFPDELGKKYGFYHADNVRGEPAPAAGGEKQGFTVEKFVPQGAFGAPKALSAADLPPGRYYFAIKSWDAAGNLSRLSNVVQVEIK